MKKKGRVGFSFGSIYAKVSLRVLKRMIARELAALMRNEGLTKSALAKRMHTSRAQLDRLLDPNSKLATFDTLNRAAQTVGRHIRMELV